MRRCASHKALFIPIVTGRINRRFGSSVKMQSVWRRVVEHSLGEQRGGRWFMPAENEDALAAALGLMPAPAEQNATP